MENLYERNGLVFWTEEEIKVRKMMEEYFVSHLTSELKKINRGFEIIQCEAPILTPREFVNNNYSDDKMFVTKDDLILRPETTGGSYEYLKHLLNKHNKRKVMLPLVVWQHGKSFRYEDEQPTKFMRLKEFYQLEFQIAYSSTTMNDYGDKLKLPVMRMINNLIGGNGGFFHLEESDRLPSYATETTDVVYNLNDMEVCSMSKRTDLDDINVFEIAIGTDRCVACFNNDI